MPDDKGNTTQADVNELFDVLKGGVALFTSQITAQADKVKVERVNGIVQLAAKAGKETDYTAKRLASMSEETLSVVESSLNDLIKQIEENSNEDTGSGHFVDRSNSQPPKLSNYELIDKMADIVSYGLGLPICTPEEKEEVRIEHMAAGLNY